MYGPFTNEQLVGKAIRDRRDQVVLAQNSVTSVALRVSFRCKRQTRLCIKPVMSLQRLGVDVIDLTISIGLIHGADRRDDRGNGRVGAAGKVRYLGMSSGSRFDGAYAVHRLLPKRNTPCGAVTQKMLLPTVRELGIGYVAYSPLGRGFLSGSSPAQKISPKMTIAEIHPDFRARISTRICNWSNR